MEFARRRKPAGHASLENHLLAEAAEFRLLAQKAEAADIRDALTELAAHCHAVAALCLSVSNGREAGARSSLSGAAGPVEIIRNA